MAAYIGEPARSKVMDVLRTVTTASQERYVPSSVAAERKEFIRLGLTDAALLEIAAKNVTLLTADLNLYLAALKNGASAFNFHHLRDQYL